MAEVFYSQNGGRPTPLPPSMAEPGGTIWTDLANNEVGRAALGLVAAPAPPEIDPASQGLDWADGAWIVVDLPPPPPTPIEVVRAEYAARVNAARDARIEGGFVFDGHPYQTRQSDRENIVRKGDRAQRAIDVEGVSAGQMFWDETLPPGQPFVFLAGDNVAVPMDAFTMVALRDAGEAFKQTCVFIARLAKAAIAEASTADAVAAIYAAITWPPSEP